MTLRLTDGRLTAVAFDSVDGSDTELRLSVHDMSDKVTRVSPLLVRTCEIVYHLAYDNLQ